MKTIFVMMSWVWNEEVTGNARQLQDLTCMALDHFDLRLCKPVGQLCSQVVKLAAWARLHW